jgi:FMN phosphatase YigB (HAD superfamily)
MKDPCAPLIVFDIGGVIVRLSSSLEEAAGRAGIKLREAVADQSRWSQLFVQWQSGQIADEPFFEQWAACVGRFDAAEAQRLSLAWLQDEFEGMDALLRELEDKGLELGCLSNTTKHHWDYLMGDALRYPSMRRLKHAHASHLIGAMKPDERIYRAFEGLTGRSPENLVFFDDLERNVVGARTCGWTALRVDPKAGPAGQVRALLQNLGLL